MGLLGGIIGGGLSAAAGIVGGIAASNAAKQNAKILNAQQQRSQNWYDQQYNSDYTQRADAQASLNAARSLLADRYNKVQGASAVSGATDESVALQKESANNTLADITTNISQNADAYKDQVRQNYVNEQNSVDAQKMGVNNQKAQAISQAASGVAQAGQSLGGVL
jgi:hypothetical protein